MPIDEELTSFKGKKIIKAYKYDSEKFSTEISQKEGK